MWSQYGSFLCCVSDAINWNGKPGLERCIAHATGKQQLADAEDVIWCWYYGGFQMQLLPFLETSSEIYPLWSATELLPTGNIKFILEGLRRIQKISSLEKGSREKGWNKKWVAVMPKWKIQAKWYLYERPSKLLDYFSQFWSWDCERLLLNRDKIQFWTHVKSKTLEIFGSCRDIMWKHVLKFSFLSSNRTFLHPRIWQRK